MKNFRIFFVILAFLTSIFQMSCSGSDVPAAPSEKTIVKSDQNTSGNKTETNPGDDGGEITGEPDEETPVVEIEEPLEEPTKSFFIAIDAGYEHSMGLKNDGTVWTWGKNNYGQLGNNSKANSSVPVQALIPQKVKAIAAGGGFSMALSEDGTIWTWGRNLAGQLGIGNRIDKLIPVQISSNRKDFVAIAAGDFHALALTKDNSIWGWGENWLGQVGDGTQNMKLSPVQIKDFNGGHYIDSYPLSIYAGSKHSIALQKLYSVYGWGDNTSYQLSDSIAEAKLFPFELLSVGASDRDYVKLALGKNFTLALGSRGDVSGWGDNSFGQLGPKNNNKTVRFQRIENLFQIKDVAAGYSFSMALEEDGTILTWGDNSFGQLGVNDSTVSGRLSPVFVKDENNVETRGVQAISAGYAHALALREDGSILAWGNNSFGQLGDGSSVLKRCCPVPIKPQQ